MIAKRTLTVLASTLAVLLPGAAMAIQPSATITSPEDGDTVSRSATPILSIEGTSQFVTPEPTTTRFFLRRNGCGEGEERFLQVASSNADTDTCRWPQWTILGSVDEEGFAEDFPATGGVPFTLDASRSITVRLVFDNEIAGAGLARARARLTGTTTTNQFVTLGDQTEEYVVTPTQSRYTHTLTLTPSPAANQADLTSLTLVVSMSGAAANHGILKLRGLSYVDMPTYSASFDRRIEVSLNTADFGTQSVTLSPDLDSWTATRSIATAPLGTNTLRARARQGNVLSDPDEVSFIVTS